MWMSGVAGAFPAPQAVCHSRFWELNFHSVSVRKELLGTQGGVEILLKDLGFTLAHSENKFRNDEIIR